MAFDTSNPAFQAGLQAAAMGVNVAAGGLPVGTLALGIYQTIAAKKKQNALDKLPNPNYEITPEQASSFATATNNSKFGYSPAQRGAFMNSIASTQNAGFQKAIDTSGGQLSSAIGRMLQSNKLRSLNQFAADDSRFQFSKQQYADSLGARISQQRNMKTSTEIQRRMQLEQALGTAGAQGLNNIASGVNYATQMGFGNKGATSTTNYNGQTSPDYYNSGYQIPSNSPLYNDPNATSTVPPKRKPYNPYSDPYNGIEYKP